MTQYDVEAAKLLAEKYNIPPEQVPELKEQAKTAPSNNGKKAERPQKVLQMPKIYLASDLMKMDFPPPKWAVPGLVPSGLSLLCGKPKLGKSWLALALALGIAHGGAVLGQIHVEAGDVLYLALEDPARRLQERMVLLCQGSVPNRLHLATEWPKMNDGAEELLGSWLAAHPDCRMVIVDTLAKFRRRVNNVRSQYDEDYQTGEELKRLADLYNVAIIVIHHLRKLGADDIMDTISGTLGLTGAVDGMLVLRRDRGRSDAVLWTTGRDIEERELALKWDSQLAIWSLLGKAEEFRDSKERADLKRVLGEADWPLTPKEVAGILGKPVQPVKWLLWKMSKDEQIRSLDGKYAPLQGNILVNDDLF